MQNISELEEKSAYIIRETKEKFENVAALWSGGKDSTAMIMIARRAFLGKVPFPVIHIDNGIDFPETYKFRDDLAKKWGWSSCIVALNLLFIIAPLSTNTEQRNGWAKTSSTIIKTAAITIAYMSLALEV